MGADGIVGVRLTVKRLEWDAKVLEFVAIGTGIVHAKGHPGLQGAEGRSPSPRRCRARISGPCSRPATGRSKW